MVARTISADRAAVVPEVVRRRQSQSVGTRGHTRHPLRATPPVPPPRLASHTGKQILVVLVQHYTPTNIYQTLLSLNPRSDRTHPQCSDFSNTKINNIYIYFKCQAQIWIVNKNFSALFPIVILKVPTDNGVWHNWQLEKETNATFFSLDYLQM